VFPGSRFEPEPPALVRVPVSVTPGGLYDPTRARHAEEETQACARDAAPADPAIDAEVALVEIVRGWMDALGPTSANALADRLGLETARVEGALARLETEGSVLRGNFTPGASATSEWCERGLLARIHRLTLGRLRQEIEPVSAADFQRALFRWQHVQRDTQLHGREGVREIIGQLQGLELPGPAWERDVLPARIASYDPADLEQLCLAGEIAWGRLAIARSHDDDDAQPVRRRQAPTRAAPLAFVLRENLAALLAPQRSDDHSLEDLSPIGGEVLQYLQQRGASFLADIARAIRRLPTEVESALWELVASGLVTGDGIAGLRTLLLPEEKRQSRAPRGARHLRPVRGRHARRLMPVGRWSLLRAEDEIAADHSTAAAAETCARRLLHRYGVVFRELCVRERHAPAWRFLLGALRRMEARGEVRGGRFVAGTVGEQFALPEAVETLRSVRRQRGVDETVIIAAADPLNLVGILTPGARVSPFSGKAIAYRDGVPVEIGDLGAVRSKMQRALA